jgi:hypothetical protein
MRSDISIGSSISSYGMSLPNSAAASGLQLLNHLQCLARQKHAAVAGSLPHRYFISKHASNDELM